MPALSCAQAAVKVHTAFTFPSSLYMDRYLAQHRGEVTEKRKHVAGLRRSIEELQERLQRLQHYSHANSKLSAEQAVAKEELYSAVISMLETEALVSGESQGDVDMCRELLSRRLRRVEEERADVEARLANLREECDAVYSHLTRHKYRLLAVLVHDGMAGSGHYWAYIKSDGDGGPGGHGETGSGSAGSGGGGRKYSDINVTQVDEEEVWSVSQGGTAHASAYCLIYTKTDKDVALERALPSFNSPDIAQHLRKEVEEDNRKLEEEIKTWDRKQRVKELCRQLEAQFTGTLSEIW